MTRTGVEQLAWDIDHSRLELASRGKLAGDDLREDGTLSEEEHFIIRVALLQFAETLP